MTPENFALALGKDIALPVEGLEHIGLVDQCQAAGLAALLAPFGELEREIEQPLGFIARDDQRLARFRLGGDAFAHRGEQAFGRLADQHEIDAVFWRADDRARHAGHQPRRPHAGVKVEDKAQLDLRHDLGIVGIAYARQAAGAKQNGVGLLAQFDGAFRHRLAGRLVVLGAGRRFREAEFQARRGRFNAPQYIERRRHHLVADAVARQHGDMESGIGGHDLFPADRRANE